MDTIFLALLIFLFLSTLLYTVAAADWMTDRRASIFMRNYTLLQVNLLHHVELFCFRYQKNGKVVRSSCRAEE